MPQPLRRVRGVHPPDIRLLAVAGLIALAGCAGPGTGQAGETAVSFAQLAADSPQQACDLLSEEVRSDLEQSEEAPCEEALSTVDLPPASALERADVYEKHARVVLEDDVVFLANFKDGWRVTAAGCEPQPEDAPYECKLGG